MNAITATRCVLIVEDEMCLAMMLEDILMDAGYDVRKAARVPGALQLVDSERFDAAILDINLAGKQVFPVADALTDRGIPFLFTSGYGDNGVPAEYCKHRMLQKPYDLDQLQAALTALLQERA
ncbi:MAG: response regulator [Lysobacter sp.]|nr:response regulator [Lysobacter sp.]